MKKKLLATIATTVILAMGLSACGSQASTSTSTDAATSATSQKSGDVTTITVWTKDRHDQVEMEAIVAQLNEEYPDMNVVYEMYTDNYYNTVDIAMGTGELPDVLCVLGSTLVTLAERDLLYPLNEFISDEMAARFDDSLFIEGFNKVGDDILTLPNTGTAVRLVYNQDIFDKVGLDGPPESLEEMVEYSKLITEKLSSEGVYGFALPMKNPTSGFQRGATSIPQLSGEPVSEGFNFKTGEYDFGVYEPVMDSLKEIFTEGYAFPGCESLEIDPLRTQFAAGKIGMYMTYNHSEWGVYTSQFPTEENWQYAMLPTETGEVTGSQSLSTGSWYGITKNCKDPEKAWRVLEAFYDLDNQVDYYEKGLGITVLDDVREKAQAPESIQKVPFIAIQETDQLWPLSPKSFTVEGDDWGTVFGAYVFGQSKDFSTLAEELNTRYNSAYQKSIADGKNTEIKYPNFKASDPTATLN